MIFTRDPWWKFVFYCKNHNVQLLVLSALNQWNTMLRILWLLQLIILKLK